jgi:hypothetical protein
MKTIILALLAASLCGCVGISESIKQRGRVISVLQTTVGLKIEPNITAGSYPGIQFGLIRTETVILLEGSNEMPSVSFETDIRNGAGIFQNGSARRKVSAGSSASSIGPLNPAPLRLSLTPEIPLLPETIK